jgi:cold-inducible RNA-binding protein
VVKKLYVGNLSYDVDNASLETMFGAYGSVKSAEVIQDRDTGRSKGFGFVEMGDDNAAQEAIRGLNESQQGGRALTVNEAKPREPRSGGSGGIRSGRDSGYRR